MMNPSANDQLNNPIPPSQSAGETRFSNKSKIDDCSLLVDDYENS